MASTGGAVENDHEKGSMMKKISIRSYGLATALVGLSLIGGATVAAATPLAKSIPLDVAELSEGAEGVQLVHYSRKAHRAHRKAHRRAHRKAHRRAHRKAHRRAHRKAQRRAHRRAHRREHRRAHRRSHSAHRPWIYKRHKHGRRFLKRRHGFNHYRHGYWYASPFWGAAYYGGGRRARSAHVEWCLDRYASYRIRSNTYRDYDGYRYKCVSPYSY